MDTQSDSCVTLSGSVAGLTAAAVDAASSGGAVDANDAGSHAVAGDPQAVDALFAVLYRDLRRLARYQLSRRWGMPLTLGATTLLHEAYIHLANAKMAASFPTHGHFLSYASKAMRSMIVDRARQRMQLKRGGLWDIVTLNTDVAENLASPEQVLDINEHLRGLESIAPELARVVDLRFFCGLTHAEIAALVGSSERVVRRDWEKARGLLVSMIRGDVVTPAAAPQ